MDAHTFDAFALVTILILAVVEPLLGTSAFRRLMRWVDAGIANARLKTYNWILAAQWVLTCGLLGWWLAQGRGPQALGLVPTAAGWQWLTIGVGLAASGVMVWQMVTVVRDPEQLQKMRGSMGDLLYLAPHTPQESSRFAAVAVTAGVCEEILYRGILLAVLTPVTGLWAAVALSSVIFGLGHAYQGPTGMGKTALVGAVMALLTVFSGSLFVAMLLHAVIDLTSGRIMAAAVRQEPAPA